jgi:hypothetical protein
VKLDINTPASVFDAVGEAVKLHVTRETKDFTGEWSVNAKECEDPMKITMSVWWKHCYNGEQGLTQCAFHKKHVIPTLALETFS